MLSHLIRKEFLDSLLNQRFIILAVFSIILMPLSGVINNKYYEARKASFDSQFGEFSQEEEALPTRAYRPPAPLSTLARGIEPFMPIYYEYHSLTGFQNEDAASPGNLEAQDFSMLSTFGNFDFLFLVQVVFSLLAILLSFDMIAGEKERGTLKAVLANNVPRDNIVVSKFAGGFAVLWLTFLIGFLLLFLVLLLFNSQFLELQSLQRIFFIFTGSTLFIASMFSIGLMVSTFCHSSRTAIVILLVVWVVLLLVIPKAGELLSQVIRPVPAEYELRVERQRIIEEEQRGMRERAGEIYTNITGQTQLDFGSQADWLDDFKPRYQALFRETQQRQSNRLRDVTQTWERQRNLQQSLGNTIALVSPASALSFLVSDAAGTGNIAYQRYREAVTEQYQIVDREIFSKRASNSYNISLGNSSWASSFGDSEIDQESIPPFQIQTPRLGEVITHNVWGIGVLAFYLLVPLLIAHVRFLGYDVR